MPIENGNKPQNTPSPPSTTIRYAPSTETSMIEVPRVIESQFTIENLNFNDELAKRNSSTFQELSQILENKIKESLFSENALNDSATRIEVKILEYA